MINRAKRRIAMEASWPAAHAKKVGPWLIRYGKGGGKRVSSVLQLTDWVPEDIAIAEKACLGLDQDLLFQLDTPGDPLDRELEARGYEMIDPVVVLACPVETIAADLPRLAVLPAWPPLAIQAEIWEQGGIGPARLEVMDRASAPKTALMGRQNDKACATAFVSCAGKYSFLHALEVAPDARRQGIGRTVMQGAANWAASQDAQEIAVLVVETNKPALNLYASLGMKPVDNYFYRIKKG